MRTSFISTLVALAEDSPKIFLVCGDLGYSVLEPFASCFPERYLNAGVAEQNMVGVAAGLAMSGYTVFVYSIGNFPTLRCLEQIRNDVCYHMADVKIVAVGSGFAYGSQGYTHHAVEDVAIMSSLPKMEVFSPADPREVVAATRLIATSGIPSYLRLSRSGEPMLSDEPILDPRKPRVLREGREVVFLATGAVAEIAVKASVVLADRGVSAAAVSVPCLKPFPTQDVLRLTEGARRVVTIEEHILRGGLYAAVCQTAVENGVPFSLRGLGVPPIERHSIAGSRESLLAGAGVTVEAAVEAALR